MQIENGPTLPRTDTVQNGYGSSLISTASVPARTAMIDPCCRHARWGSTRLSTAHLKKHTDGGGWGLGERSAPLARRPLWVVQETLARGGGGRRHCVAVAGCSCSQSVSHRLTNSHSACITKSLPSLSSPPPGRPPPASAHPGPCSLSGPLGGLARPVSQTAEICKPTRSSISIRGIYHLHTSLDVTSPHPPPPPKPVESLSAIPSWIAGQPPPPPPNSVRW